MVSDMDAHILESYIDRIYGYALKHTFTLDEADELSQEIMLRAISELPRLRDESRFEPWLWGVAKNVRRSFSRYRGRLRSVVSFDEIPEPIDFETDISEDELSELLIRRILELSAVYCTITTDFRQRKFLFASEFPRERSAGGCPRHGKD